MVLPVERPAFFIAEKEIKPKKVCKKFTNFDKKLLTLIVFS